MIKALIQEARPKQWMKNVLVFAAPGAAGVLSHRTPLWQSLVMFVAFCLTSAGTYYWNDILDVVADRSHPKKQHRPIASGAIPLGTARVVGTALLVGGPLLALVTRWQAAAVLALYATLTTSYSKVFKHIAVVDLVIVASGFVLRAIGGASATGDRTGHAR
jgi:decaprenyl-phosphate phosphoribosyltransferase